MQKPVILEGNPRVMYGGSRVKDFLNGLITTARHGEVNLEILAGQPLRRVCVVSVTSVMMDDTQIIQFKGWDTLGRALNGSCTDDGVMLQLFQIDRDDPDLQYAEGGE